MLYIVLTLYLCTEPNTQVISNHSNPLRRMDVYLLTPNVVKYGQYGVYVPIFSFLFSFMREDTQCISGGE